MGLFNRKPKEQKWFINKKRGTYTLENKYIRLYINLLKTEHILFYKDILDIKKGKKCVRVSSKTETYTISVVDNPGVVDDLYVELLEKISEYK